MQLGLNDKVAIVTGSGRGIGAETARALAEEGARIVVTDIDAQVAADHCAALQRDGFQAIAVAADVTQAAEVERLVQSARDAFGSVHVLVNNAGFARDARITKLSEADWDAVVDTVLKGAFLCTKAVAPVMAAQHWGRVVNISSRAHLGQTVFEDRFHGSHRGGVIVAEDAVRRFGEREQALGGDVARLVACVIPVHPRDDVVRTKWNVSFF